MNIPETNPPTRSMPLWHNRFSFSVNQPTDFLSEKPHSILGCYLHSLDRWCGLWAVSKFFCSTGDEWSQAQAGGPFEDGRKKRGWDGSPFMISAVLGILLGDVPMTSPGLGDRTYEYSCNRRDSSETEVAKHRTTDADPTLEKIADILPDAHRGNSSP